MDKKSAILRAAERKFEEKGFRKTTIAEIAKEADVSVRTLYAYFPNKEGLFQAVRRPELREFDPASDRKKQRVLRAAVKQFSQKGFSAVTMDDVALSSGFSKTVIYQYFENKEALFAAVFSQTAFFTKHPELPFEASVTNLIAYLQDTGIFFLHLFDDKERLGLIRAVLSEPQYLPQSGKIMYQNTVEKVTEKISVRLHRYVLSGVIKNVDCKLVVRSFMGGLYSFVLTSRLLNASKEKMDVRGIVESIVSLYIYGMVEK